jgi:catechol 2,3-dioxygenase
MVKPMQLGHANIRVSDVERAERFYTDVLGLHVTQRRGTTVFLSLRDHSHELAIRAMGPEAQPADKSLVGTNHFAREMGSFEDLQAMYDHLKEMDVKILGTRNNSYSVGVYFNDPDGNGNEVYFEETGGWRQGEWGGTYHRTLED